MHTVYKYEIRPDSGPIELPMCALVLSVAFQGEKLCIWAKGDTDAPTESRLFEVFGTGHKIPDPEKYSYIFCGTAHTGHGLVFHVFEKLPFPDNQSNQTN